MRFLVQLSLKYFAKSTFYPTPILTVLDPSFEET